MDGLESKVSLLKLFLRVSAFFQATYFGLSHLIAPDWYLNSIGVDFVARGFSLVTMNEIGLLSLGTALITWIAASDPIRYAKIIGVLCAIAFGSSLVSSWHILAGNIPPGEWMTVFVLLVQLFLIGLLFPWSHLKNRPPEVTGINTKRIDKPTHCSIL
jgi:hypothetical protein